MGESNPFRYKGYYYDVETSLYYCNARYYNPEIGRWINADDVSYLDPSSVNGLNLYAYCGNNPIMYSDPNGNFPILTLAIISGILIVGGGVLGGVSAHQNGTNVWEGIGKGMGAGAILSASLILTVGSFYVTGGLGSNLGLMMFTYGSTTLANMLEVGITQERFSVSKGESWSSNITNAMIKNSLRIYGVKGATRMLPFAQHFTWYWGAIKPGSTGPIHDLYTFREAGGFLKNYLGKTPTNLSYVFATITVATNTYNLGKSIFGVPNYDKWSLY